MDVYYYLIILHGNGIVHSMLQSYTICFKSCSCDVFRASRSHEINQSAGMIYYGWSEYTLFFIEREKVFTS